MWTLVQRKIVHDSDGFLTEYSWYYEGVQHVFVFGDSDIYRPEDEWFDWECESWDEATEWFDAYEGVE